MVDAAAQTADVVATRQRAEQGDASALYLLATRYGPLSVVVTLASLYPASTVILARLVLGERLNAWQAVGVACALVAIALIVGGSRPF